MSLTNTIGRLLPIRQVVENTIINQFALDGTGEAGTFVAVSAGNFDDQQSWDFNATPGASFDRISSFLNVTKTKVRPVTSGDTRDVVLGAMQFNVAETDENGEKFRFYTDKAVDNHVILSGQTVPVYTEGVFGVTSQAWTNASNNLPDIGEVLVPSNEEDGKVYFAAREDLGSEGYAENQILGKVIGTGAKFGGYAMVKLGVS